MSAIVQTRWFAYLLMLALLAATTLPNLGAHSLWDIDEGFYCQASADMYHRHDWLEPRFNGELFSEKPIMIYWLQLASYSVFGVNEFAARVPSVVCGLAVLLITYELGRSMFSHATGLLASVALATCVEFCLQAHAATPDMPLVLFTLGALAIFWWSWKAGHHHWLLGFGMLTGLAILTKGPIGVALPAGIVGLFLIWEGKLKNLVRWQLVVGLLLLAAVVAPWYIAIHERSSGAFLSEFWGTHNIHRFTKPMHGKSGPIYYQLVGLCIFFAPWCLCILVTFYQAFRLSFGRMTPSATVDSPLSRARSEEIAQHRDAYRVLLIWCVAFVVFFSLSATKFTHYIFPMYPTLAILTARTLDRWRLRQLEVSPAILMLSWLSLLLVGGITAIGFSVAGGGISIPGAKVRILQGLASYWWIGMFPIMGAVASLLLYRQQKRMQALTWIAASSAAYVGLIAAFPVMAVDQLKAPRSLAQQSGLQSFTSQSNVSAYDYPQPSLVYYLGAKIQKLSDPFSVQRFLSQEEPAYLVIPEETWQKISPDAKVATQPIARAYDFYRHEQILVLGNDAAKVRTAQLHAHHGDSRTLQR